MNKRSQAMLRDFAHEVPASDERDHDGFAPVGLARLMVDHNNAENGSTLDLWSTYIQAPDHTWWSIAWVYDTGPAPRLCRHCSDPLDSKDPSVDLVTGESFCGANPHFNRHETEHGGDVTMCWWQRTSCPSCEGYGYVELFHPSTDALIGSRDCPETHPAPPPPPVSLVKAHYCDDPNHCCPF